MPVLIAGAFDAYSLTSLPAAPNPESIGLMPTDMKLPASPPISIPMPRAAVFQPFFIPSWSIRISSPYFRSLRKSFPVPRVAILSRTWRAYDLAKTSIPFAMEAPSICACAAL